MPSELNPRSSSPLYQQVMEDIVHDIASGLYRAGEKIPSEADLGDIYDVSRITVRRAVEELVKQGKLTKRQGKGTFVNEAEEGPSSFQNDDIVQSFSVTCEANGVVPGAVLVTRELAPLPDGGAAFFGGACARQTAGLSWWRTISLIQNGISSCLRATSTAAPSFA